VIRISKALITGDTYVANARNGALAALDIIEEAVIAGKMQLPEMELTYLPVLREDLTGIPDDEGKFIEMMAPVLVSQNKFIPSEYGL